MRPAVAILAYEKPRPWWRRRRARRWAGLAATLLAVLWVGPTRIGNSVRQLWTLYWQEECLTHSAPADREVFVSSGPRRAPSAPACWRAYGRLLPQPTVAGGGGGANPVIFLHAVRNTDGEERLVAVELTGVARRPEHWDLMFRTRTVRPAAWTSAPLDGGWERALVTVGHGGDPGAPLRIFAAHPDPRDDGSFSFTCDAGGVATVVRGSMCGDYVVLEAARTRLEAATRCSN